MLSLLRRNRCVVSAVLPVEVRSALRRRTPRFTFVSADERQTTVADALGIKVRYVAP